MLAHNLASELAAHGLLVVSGLARGIDTAAHEGALAAGAPTIAVIASGVDVAYPSENAELMERIAADRRDRLRAAARRGAAGAPLSRAATG